MPRLQLVISDKFITLSLLALALLGGGCYWYTRQQEAQERQNQTRERFKTPPYFVNHGASVMRSCQQCVDAGRLKPQGDGWRVGSPKEIPADEQRWFLAVEDPPVPVTVSGVLMLPVYSALRDDPAFGFDQSRVILVLYQNLQRMSSIQQLPSVQPVLVATAQPSPPQSPQAAASQQQSSFIGEWRNEDSQTQGVTRFSVAGSGPDELTVHPWGKCSPVDCDWKESPATVSDDILSVLWNRGFATCAWQVSQEPDGRLRVLEHIHFTDGRRDVYATRFFSRSPEGKE
jgi:hypothetical protein